MEKAQSRRLVLPVVRSVFMKKILSDELEWCYFPEKVCEKLIKVSIILFLQKENSFVLQIVKKLDFIHFSRTRKGLGKNGFILLSIRQRPHEMSL